MDHMCLLEQGLLLKLGISSQHFDTVLLCTSTAAISMQLGNEDLSSDQSCTEEHMRNIYMPASCGGRPRRSDAGSPSA